MLMALRLRRADKAVAVHGPTGAVLQKEADKQKAAEARKQGNELASLKRSADQRQRQFEKEAASNGDDAGPRGTFTGARSRVWAALAGRR